MHSIILIDVNEVIVDPIHEFDAGGDYHFPLETEPSR